jgi:BlaI family transcriptional regulator, penicillinase repressor
MHLTNAEEQVMKYLWRIDKGFIRDILNQYPDPKPATTTVITLLKRMIDKGFVQYKQYGINREYYPTVKKTEYFSKQINGIIKDFFNDSSIQFASFFTTETELNQKELSELRDIIDRQITNNLKKDE